MNDSALGWFIIGGLLLLTVVVWDSLIRVPRGQIVVIYRRGRFLKFLHGGIHFRLPAVDWVRERFTVGPQKITLSRELCISSDSSPIQVTCTIAYTLTDVQQAAHHTSTAGFVESNVVDRLHSVIRNYPSVTALHSKDAIAGELAEALEQDLAQSGRRLDSVTVAAISTTSQLPG